MHTYLRIVESVGRFAQLLKLKTIFSCVDKHPEVVLFLGVSGSEGRVWTEAVTILGVTQGKVDPGNR